MSVVGNVAVDSARVLRSFEVPPGSRYSEEAIRRGFRKLFALGLFEDIQIERIDRGEGSGVVDLVLHVKERPRIGKIEFVGNKRRETSELEKKLFLHVGETYSLTQQSNQIDTLTTYYHDEGFALATVKAFADTLPARNEVSLRFQISEGERVKIEDVHFIGMASAREATLRKQMKSKRHWILGGGEVKEENLPEDRDKLEHWYRSHGFRDMRVVSTEFVPGTRRDRVILNVTIDEGRRYWFGRVAWSGNQIVPTPQLQSSWGPGKYSLYDLSRIEHGQGDIYAAYAEQGYLYIGVEPRETVHDSIVDVTYFVTEGKPSNIRYVVISGNKGTREKVIRREVDVHEGDRFRRSALVRTQGNIFRLGLFEDVGVDFTPADSTDVDIQLKVKEKQVGTASAGAGYTSDGGLTGFLELGHTNVLGNGQSLNLHLERGGRRENYFLSFTEPWFHDSPTLLGFTAFDNSQDLDLYKQKRVGGSARIGRPLPWPDYSRGSVLYQLERVTTDALSSTLTPADSIALAGLTVGVPVLTSSVVLDFQRNTADNPFYPHHGTRLLLSSELAGGPFGGSVNYNKNRIEGRAWFRSPIHFMTTMVRQRFGILAPYPDQNLPVPTYERFRLGGGSTPDPLRGYDDYMIVPSKFIQDVTTRGAISNIDSLTTPGEKDTTYYTYTQRVRYPGGRFLSLFTLEQQFPIVLPLRGVIFFDAGNVWDKPNEIRPFDLKMGAGAGFRMEIPLLGNIGFDYGYGFNRDDRPRWVGHFLLGNVNF